MDDVSSRSLGVALAIVGVALWIIAMVVDAGPVAIVLPILMVMGGALHMARTDPSDP